ncbi:Ribonuclease H-like superfamily protein [Gossypium australe]|uniref:Ribonuclease H-like superfamily protein n=1 Tax=Gossypium australe TaxID=47621 RepID=A0A5B6VFK3_9ROSI|nr:Ribonuclease H-like superfamily protein [Gossypium australe]
MGFRNMAQFNVAMLAKQGWGFLENPNSLVAQVFKAKYFSKSNFLNSQLGNKSSYVWCSIWAARGILEKGLIWKVGTGTSISIVNDEWVPDLDNYRLLSSYSGSIDNNVAELINCQTKEWNMEVINFTFGADETERILCIPLTKHPHVDLMAWRGEPSGSFSVKNNYKLLQRLDPNAYAIHPVYNDFYKKLWSIDLPTKIKINILKASWNYLPTRVNLLHKKLATEATCPRCGLGTETLNHLFRECPISVEVWTQLSKIKVLRYTTKLDGVKNRLVKSSKAVNRWKHPPHQTVKINFDGAFAAKEHRSASGIVARGSERSVLVSKSRIHEQVASAFEAEALACGETVQLGIDMQKEEFVMDRAFCYQTRVL